MNDEDDSLLRISALKMAELIREKKISSEKIVSAHIERIRKVNPVLNAMVKDCFSKALKQAKAADDKLKDTPIEKLPPLHGVPCTIKENFKVTGMPNAAGCVTRRHLISRQDATVVQRLRKAGAIVLGVTNTSELCLWMESMNRVYGRTNNPYNQAHTVGGSSGGEGSIVASGGSPFGIGSDIGGSIRMPAFFNGVFGHKPTGGLIPNSGQYPEAENEATQYLTTGPLCRKAEDLWPLVQILAGPDGSDPGCIPMQLGDPKKVAITKLNIIVGKDARFIRQSGEQLTAQLQAADALKNLGAKISTSKVSGFEKGLNIWSCSMQRASRTSFRDIIKSGEPVSLPKEILKWVLGKSDHMLPAIALVGLEKLYALTPGRVQKFFDEGERIRENLIKEIGPDGVLLFPSYPALAPRHHAALLLPFGWVHTAFFNIMRFPVTQVPLGLSRKGLPLGIQVVSTPGNDHITIAVAQQLEKIFGGWVWPNALD